MKNTILFALPCNDFLARPLIESLKMERGLADFHDFPDGEVYVRVESEVKNKQVLLLCTLDHPNDKMLRLLFLAETLRELGAGPLCLLAPYLPYMRQDRHFKPGDALTSAIFARLLSGWVDELITIDPHLHRIHQLSEVYSIPKIAHLHAGRKMAAWIQQNVSSPLLIGPDEESRQWVSAVAEEISAPCAIISKIRRGDRSVEIRLPELKERDKTPVLVDDIISTGASMQAALCELGAQGFKKAYCVCVHALFDREVHDNLLRAGAVRVVSCNTVAHFTNEIDVSSLIEAELRKAQ